MYIRHGTLNDIPAIQRIARQWSDARYLAFVRRASLVWGIERESLLVAIEDDQVIGFILYNARRDGWATVYDLAADRDHMRSGVGRALLYAVPCPMRLKCAEDNDLGNKFYAGAGMRRAGREASKNRDLIIWEMRVLNIQREVNAAAEWQQLPLL